MSFNIFLLMLGLMVLTKAEEVVLNGMQKLQDFEEPLISNDCNDKCVSSCPRILDPICAVDENHPASYKYFHNLCLMEYDSCRKSRAWKPTQMLLCLQDVDPLVRDDCMRACPLIYNPVCASDGKNYEIFGNQCIFGMENCLANGKWLEVQAEQCGL